MRDKDPQDQEIIAAIADGGTDPQKLIDGLVAKGYPMSSIIEALQRAIERGCISLNSDGMVVAVKELAHAA